MAIGLFNAFITFVKTNFGGKGFGIKVVLIDEFVDGFLILFEVADVVGDPLFETFDVGDGVARFAVGHGFGEHFFSEELFDGVLNRGNADASFLGNCREIHRAFVEKAGVNGNFVFEPTSFVEDFADA